MAERVHMVSLGCPKNRVDSEVMVGQLMAGDFEMVDDADAADVIIVNTCSFIQPATEESVETILEMAQHKTAGTAKKLIVTGCMVQRYGRALEDELPEVDAFVGTGEYHRIREILDNKDPSVRSHIDAPLYIHDEFSPRINSWKPHSAYLKIGEGCDHRCTFCIIPQLRGKMRSRSIPSLITEATRLVGEGVKELNLVSQDSTAYGRDLADGTDLGGLLRGLGTVPDLAWVRLHYAYPIGLPESLLTAIRDVPNVVSYLDIPLQHASGPMLKAMRRGVTRDGQERRLDRIEKHVPGIAIRTTFIVGFPGETDEDFAELCDFVRTRRFERVGVFTYFQEDGTPAAKLPGQVPDDVKEARQAELMGIQAEISRARHAELEGQVCDLLVDGRSEEHEWVWTGRLESQAPDVDGQVYIDEAPADLAAGQIRKVRITGSSDYDLVAQVVS